MKKQCEQRTGTKLDPICRYCDKLVFHQAKVHCKFNLKQFPLAVQCEKYCREPGSDDE